MHAHKQTNELRETFQTRLEALMIQAIDQAKTALNDSLYWVNQEPKTKRMFRISCLVNQMEYER